jgi:hypothetical protein
MPENANHHGVSLSLGLARSGAQYPARRIVGVPAVIVGQSSPKLAESSGRALTVTPWWD